MVLLRLNIVDCPTGVCIFQKIWNWRGDMDLAENKKQKFSKLIASIVNLSFSLGGKGEVGFALLDPPPQNRSSIDLLVEQRASKRGGSGGSGPGRGQRPGRSKGQVRCLFAKKGDVVVVLCHEIGDEIPSGQACAVEILKVFVKEYKAKLGELRPVFDDLGADKVVRDSAMSEEDVIEEFREFEILLDGLTSIKSLLRPKERKSLEDKLNDSAVDHQRKMRFSADMAVGQKSLHASGDFVLPSSPRISKEEANGENKEKDMEKESKRKEKEVKDSSDDEKKEGSGSSSGGTPKEERKKKGSSKEKKKQKEKKKMMVKSLPAASPRSERKKRDTEDKKERKGRERGDSIKKGK